ncbi:hypothetical protein V8E54_012388 [Elaphomyces granulatus]
MGFSVNPLVLFAQKRQVTLDIDSSIIPTSEAGDDVTSTNNKSTLVLLVTKYGLRLHVSHDATIEISIQHPPPLEKSVHDDVDSCNSNLPTLNAVAPLPDPPIDSYRIVPSWCTSCLWSRTDGEVLDEEIEARYPRLANFYFDWVEIFNDAFESQPESDILFPKAEDYLVWKTEGLLLACWLALQDEVQEVEYLPFLLRKGHLEEEILRFLMDTENLWEMGTETETGTTETGTTETGTETGTGTEACLAPRHLKVCVPSVHMTLWLKGRGCVTYIWELIYKVHAAFSRLTQDSIISRTEEI